jgi:hypothetical protein
LRGTSSNTLSCRTVSVDPTTGKQTVAGNGRSNASGCCQATLQLGRNVTELRVGYYTSRTMVQAAVDNGFDQIYTIAGSLADHVRNPDPLPAKCGGGDGHVRLVMLACIVCGLRVWDVGCELCAGVGCGCGLWVSIFFG